jgi:hypothetical protein
MLAPGLPAVRVEPAREVLLRPEEDHRASGEGDVVPPAPRGDDEVDEQLGAADELAVADLELERLAAVRAARDDGAVGVERAGDPERVPGAVREPDRPSAWTRCGVSTAENGFSIRISVVPGCSTSAWASWRRL